MTKYISQKQKEKLKYVDEDLLVNKIGRKAFKRAAYAIGLAVGFFLLSPFLPDVGNKEKQDAIIGAFHVLALWLILYGALITVTFFFMREKLKLVMFILNWFVIPTVALKAVIDIMDAMK